MPGAARTTGTVPAARAGRAGGDPAPRGAVSRVRRSWRRSSGPRPRLATPGRAAAGVVPRALMPARGLARGVTDELDVEQARGLHCGSLCRLVDWWVHRPGGGGGPGPGRWARDPAIQRLGRERRDEHELDDVESGGGDVLRHGGHSVGPPDHRSPVVCTRDCAARLDNHAVAGLTYCQVVSKRQAVEAAVLRATEELLEEGHSHADLDVGRIATRAGIGRTAFYFYFRDKRELLMRLTADVSEQLYAVASRWFAGDDEELVSALREIGELYREHAALLRVIVEVSTYDDEVAGVWRGVVGRFVEATQSRIEAEDAELPAAATAFALVWMTERAFHQL